MKKAAAKAKPKPKVKPVTVTISRIARALPCSLEFNKFLRRVGGRAPRSYLREYPAGTILGANHVKITSSTPIPLAHIYKMKQYWGDWVQSRVLTSQERDRWYREGSPRTV